MGAELPTVAIERRLAGYNLSDKLPIMLDLARSSTELSAVERVVADLAERITSDLTPGSRLPSETEMASTYAVSRLTVREAVRELAGRGLLDLGRGRRAIVREADAAAFSNLLGAATRHDAQSFLALMEVRQALEIQSAMLAAKRVTRAGLVAIQAALDGMGQAVVEIERGDERVSAERRFNQFDVGFHEALALTGGNRMLSFLLDAMAGPLAASFKMSTRGRAVRGRTHASTLDAHRRVYDCVRDGDARAAGLAMRIHLRDAERDLRAAFGDGPEDHRDR